MFHPNDNQLQNASGNMSLESRFAPSAPDIPGGVSAPRRLPEMAIVARNQGFPLCATSQSNSRSVLPGNGKGITDGSTTATAKGPRAPRCVSRSGRSDECTRGAGCCGGGTPSKKSISACGQATQMCEDSSRRDSAQSDPIIPAPTKHASHRVQREHAEQAIEGAYFGRLELNRIAARTFAPDPKKLREPIGPVPASLSHFAVSFCTALFASDL